MACSSPCRIVTGRLPAVLVASLALGLGGCGLSEYEATLAAEQKRLERFDEEDRLLGDPLELPPRKGKDPSVPIPSGVGEVFIRPPLWTASNYQSEPLGELLYRYPPFPHNWFMRRRIQVPDNPFLEVDLAVTPEGDWAEFTQKVQQPFQGMAHSEATLVKKPTARGVLEFQSLTFADGGNPPATKVFLYFYKGHQTQVAIAYRVKGEEASSPKVTNAIDASLKSLVVGPQPASLRKRFTTQK